jgi:hypothetical protein
MTQSQLIRELKERDTLCQLAAKHIESLQKSVDHLRAELRRVDGDDPLLRYNP